MSKTRLAKLREIRDVVSGVVAQLAQHPSFLEGPANTNSYPEFNVQYYTPAFNAELHGTTEVDSFVAALDSILEKQAGVMQALEKSAKRSMFLQGSDRSTQSPMVWLNLRPAAHASMLESQPMGPSEATINVFEASHSMLLESQPQRLTGPHESVDFWTETGGALAGAASLASISEKSDDMLRKIKPSASLIELPAMNVHVAQGGAMEAVQLSESQQTAILNQRDRLIQ